MTEHTEQEKSPGGEGMLPLKVGAGQKRRCSASMAEQGCEDHPLETLTRKVVTG